MGTKQDVMDGNRLDQDQGALKHDDARYGFAKWFRRAMKVRRIRIRDARAELNVPTQEFNNWIEDEKGLGRPVVPDNEDCFLIAELLNLGPDIVIGIAEEAREAQDRMIELDHVDDDAGNVLD